MSNSNRVLSDDLTTPRRDFLKLTLLTGGALAASRMVRNAQATELEQESEAAAPQKEGYRVTPHIKEYYEKARF